MKSVLMKKSYKILSLDTWELEEKGYVGHSDKQHNAPAQHGGVHKS